MKQDISLEYLKFFATLLIINSHIGTCYGDYEYLATGGAIGNGLFFFVSGFALSLGRLDRIDNWLKRRCLRLFPSVISKGILGYLLFGVSLVTVNQLVNGGGVVPACNMHLLSDNIYILAIR